MNLYVRMCSIVASVAICSTNLVPLVAHGEVELECKQWFLRTKIAIDDSSCRTKCTSASVDLGTFVCTDRCDELCRPVIDCKSYRKWLTDSFTNNPPVSWDESSEKTKPWTAREKKLVLDAAMSLPRELVEKSHFKIHRMPLAKSMSNPAATKNSDITLYDRAFQITSPPLARVLAHELAHVYWNNISKTERLKYEMAANWMRFKPEEEPVRGRALQTFTEPDGAMSPWEDFANNVEYLLFNPEKLKTLTPSLFGWFQGTLGANFKLGGECGQKTAK